MATTVAADDDTHGHEIVAVGIASKKENRLRAAKLALAAQVALQQDNLCSISDALAVTRDLRPHAADYNDWS